MDFYCRLLKLAHQECFEVFDSASSEYHAGWNIGFVLTHGYERASALRLARADCHHGEEVIGIH